MSRPIDIATPLGPGELLLTNFSGEEHLGRTSSFRLRLKSKRNDISGESMLGRNVTIRLEIAGGRRPARYFNGYITGWAGVSEIVDALDGPSGTKAYLYDAAVHPWLWFLSRQSNSRIFQNKQAPDILKQVFKDHGDLANAEFKLKNTYRTIVFCCQYRETDLNFVSRLMEQEGIYFYFRHENGKHTMVLADATSHHTSNDGFGELRFDLEDRPDMEPVSTWQGRHEIQSGKYVTDDYNPETPGALLVGAAQKQRQHPYATYEHFDYPAGFDTAAEGRQYATTRLDELQSQYHTFTGSSKSRGLQTGSTFELKRHPVADAKYLIIGTSYECSCNTDSAGNGPFHFDSTMRAIPATQQFRPPRVTPKPAICGPQTAVVVGPAGQEIYTDDKQHMGCVKVHFRWDRYSEANENSSCWIRVATSWAGNAYGAIAIPRIGQEVVVEYLEGDPDRPIITGSVYNAVNKPPYPLPGQMTRWGLKSRSSPGGGASNFNELRFEDKKGSEEVYFHAEKNFDVYIKNDRKEKVLNESHLDVAKDSLAKYGADVHTDIQGDDIAKTGGGVHLTIGQDWQAKVGTKLAANVGQEIHLKAGTTLILESGTQISLKVGGNFIDINPGGVFIKGTMVMVNSGGSAGTGSGASPKTPKTAKQAVDSTGGTDKPMTAKVQALMAARASSTPFCEICNS